MVRRGQKWFLFSEKQNEQKWGFAGLVVSRKFFAGRRVSGRLDSDPLGTRSRPKAPAVGAWGEEGARSQ